MASLHLRTGSIKRTPSDLSQALANVDLPAPSAIRNAGKTVQSNQQGQQVNDSIGDLDLDEPEGEHRHFQFCIRGKPHLSSSHSSHRLKRYCLMLDDSSDYVPSTTGIKSRSRCHVSRHLVVGFRNTRTSHARQRSSGWSQDTRSQVRYTSPSLCSGRYDKELIIRLETISESGLREPLHRLKPRKRKVLLRRRRQRLLMER